MTKEEIQASIKSIMFSGSVCGIEIYACLRDESGYQTKKIRATDKLLSSTKDKVAGFINCTYLADDAEFDTSENIADNKKEFYEIMTKKFMTAHCINEQDIQSISPIFLPRYKNV